MNTILKIERIRLLAELEELKVRIADFNEKSEAEGLEKIEICANTSSKDSGKESFVSAITNLGEYFYRSDLANLLKEMGCTQLTNEMYLNNEYKIYVLIKRAQGGYKAYI